MSVRRSSVAKTVIASAVGAVLLGQIATPAGASAGASARQSGRSTNHGPIIEGLAGPLGLAVASPTKIAVAESSGGMLALYKHGKLSPVVTVAGADISGTAFDADGRLVFTMTKYPPSAQDEFVSSDAASLNVVTKTGYKELADIWGYEYSKNPDQNNTYGFLDLPASCDLGDLGPQGPSPVPYKGQKDSHAYKVAAFGDDSYYVADAAGNDIVKVNKHGKVSTVAVLPPVKVKITSALATTAGLPPCAAGATFAFEAVPTDVEVGRDGYLYVSGLTGASEVLPMNAGGIVWRVNPRNGHVQRLAGGLHGAVDLAVTPDGTIYVAELFGNQVSKISCGRVSKVATVNQPGAIEWFRGKLYVTTDVLAPPVPPTGTVITLRR